MSETTSWLPQFDTWTEELSRRPAPRVPEHEVHKQQPDNVFISRMEPVEGRPDVYAVQLVIPVEHPYFFEHHLDHIPGLALIEAGRQAGLVAAHRYYNVLREGCTFFINELHASFSSFATLHMPVFGCCVFTDVRMRRERLVRMKCTGHYLQRGRPIGTLTGIWNVVPEAVIARMRRGAGVDA